MITLATALNIGASAVDAQIPNAAIQQEATPRACAENFWYITTSGVNIRQQPGGKIVGKASSWERVDVLWRNGVWVYVHFKNRPLYVHPRAGYVHQSYVDFHQPTC